MTENVSSEIKFTKNENQKHFQSGGQRGQNDGAWKRLKSHLGRFVRDEF